MTDNPNPEDTTPSRRSIVPSRKLNRKEKRAHALNSAKVILSRYTTTTQTSPGYIAELADYLFAQPMWIIDRITNRELGITAEHPDFPPSIGHVVEMGKRLKALEASAEKLQGILKGRTVRNYLKVEPPPKHRYLNDPDLSIEDCPRLAAAFWKDPEATAILTKARGRLLREAVEAHARYGVEAARKVILG